MPMREATADDNDDSNPPLKARLLSRAMRTGPLFQTALWTQMPLLAMVSPRVTDLDAERCAIEIPFNWRNRNVFGTMYFAASMMAAEATTGGLVFYHDALRRQDCSFIVRGVSADFVDKAQSRVRFECTQGDVVDEAFSESARSDERVERTLEVVGWRDDGTEIARVHIDWSWRGK